MQTEDRSGTVTKIIKPNILVTTMVGQDRQGETVFQNKDDKSEGFYLRIPKCPGTSAGHDLHSPILRMAYCHAMQTIRVHTAETREVDELAEKLGHHAAPIFSPYANRVVRRPPVIILSKELLHGQVYMVDTQTFGYGDFLILTCNDSGNKINPRTIMLNIWGINLLDGIATLVIDQKNITLMFENREVGKIPVNSPSAKPFIGFSQKGLKYAEYRLAVREFAEASFRQAMRWHAHSEIKNGLVDDRVIEQFSHADMDINGDRATGDTGRAFKRAQDALFKLMSLTPSRK